MAERLDDAALKALLSEEIRAAQTYDDSELSERRARAMEYYRGVMTDTPAAPGRSSVVSRDTADVIGWMLPGIIRVYTASDRMAEYEPVRPSDEAGAQQATDYANHIFWKDNPGYRILWDATHDSLLQGNGIVKHWWDDKEECEYSEHSGMTAEQIAMLLSEGQADNYGEGDKKSPGVEIVAQKPGEPQKVIDIDPMTGQQVEMEIPTFDIKLKRVTMAGRVRIECIKPEDFLLDTEATCIEDARFCAHRDEISKSDLIEMGFDKALVEELPAFHYSMTMVEEKLARQKDFIPRNDTGDDATHLVEVFECYIKADADGDGIAETVRAYYAGHAGAGELLDWEVWDDDVPFSDIPCEPVPHRWDARSVADETQDIQRIKTVLTRQFLDNLYWVNNPMNEVEADSVINPEMLTAPKFGGTVWRKKGAIATAPIKPLAIPFIGDKALMGLEHFDQVTEKRTGVSRSTMALDPEALTNQTATANQNQRDAAYSQIELIARNQAELGWRRVFRQILRLIVKHQDRPRTIRLRDEWVEIDPRHWNAGMDVTINVGLGTGSRDRDMAMLNNILATQKVIAESLAAGGFADKAIDMIPKVIATAVKLAESAGIKNPDTYYPQIDEDSVQQMKAQAAERAKQPPPEVLKEQAKAQVTREVETIKAQAQAYKEKIQAEADVAAERAKAELQAFIDQVKAGFEREKHQDEMAFKERELQQEWQIELLKLNASRESERDQLAHDEKSKKHESRSKQNELLIKSGKDPIPDEGTDAMKALEALIKRLNAPKRVVRDESGRAIGVETIEAD